VPDARHGRNPYKEHSMKRCLTLALAALALAAPARAADNPVVVMETSMGTIKIELFPDKAPVTVKNFLSYVDDKHYDGTIFHRVMKGFMIQGGGFQDGKEKATKDPIKNEAGNGLSNKRYTIAMARTNIPDSATSQFYINQNDNSGLDRANARDGVGYCVFGQVIDGKDVVEKIANVRTGRKELTDRRGERGSHADVPLEDVVIKSVRREEKK
jgi:cyclophilin family peptidyl-prolyl cis-trans isomerase